MLWDVAMVEQAGLEPEVYAAQLRNTMVLPTSGSTRRARESGAATSNAIAHWPSSA